MHFKVTKMEPNYCKTTFDITAESEEQAIEIVKEELAQEGIEAGHLWVTRVSDEDMIKKEKEETARLIREIYFNLNYDLEKLTVREYTNISRKLNNDTEEQLKMYQDVNRSIRICKLLKERAKLNLSVMTVAEFEALHRKLWEAKTEDVFEMALYRIPTRLRLK